MKKRSLFFTFISIYAVNIHAASDNQSSGYSNSSALPTAQPDNSYLTLGTMVVSGSDTGPLKSQDMLTSVDILGQSMIEHENVDFSWELFRKLPGITITNFNQGNVSGEFSMRGFNGEGEINAVKLLLDGIPANSNSGNMEYLDMVNPLDIQSIELVRGTNDPRYGLHNIAGNANITTRTGGNYAKGRVNYGSFDTFDAQFSGGVETGDFTQNYYGTYRESSGYRDHAEMDRFSLGGKWFYAPENENFRLGIIARWYESDADSPGYLTLEELRQSPTQSPDFNNSDRGKRQLGQISGHLDMELTDELSWSLKSYANRIDDSRFVRFAERFSQQERITEENHYGAITTMTYRPEVAILDDLVLEGGFDFQQQDNKSIRYVTADRDRQRQSRHQEFDFAVYGGYVQAIVKPTSWLKLVPAVRIDSASGNFSNRLNGQKRDLNDYDIIWQPKFSAVITPFDGYSLYGNWGRTFQVGIGAGAFRNRSEIEGLNPSINEGWEVGLKFSPVNWLDGRLAYWEQDATNEVRRLFNASNDSANIGETKRRGVDVQFNLRPVDPLLIWAAYSWQEGIIKRPQPNELETRGNEIDHIPEFIFSGGIDYDIIPNLRASFNAYAQGNYYINRANTGGQFGDYFLINLALNYQVTDNLGLEFQVTNLTNEFWEYVWDIGNSLHSPGDERAFYGGVTMQF